MWRWRMVSVNEWNKWRITVMEETEGKYEWKANNVIMKTNEGVIMKSEMKK